MENGGFKEHPFGSWQTSNGRSELGRSFDDDTDEINGRVGCWH